MKSLKIFEPNLFEWVRFLAGKASIWWNAYELRYILGDNYCLHPVCSRDLERIAAADHGHSHIQDGAVWVNGASLVEARMLEYHGRN